MKHETEAETKARVDAARAFLEKRIPFPVDEGAGLYVQHLEIARGDKA